MNSNINILISSSGTRNKIVQYFKNEIKGIGKVITTDASLLAPSIYDSDNHYIVPKINEDGYLDKILDICQKEKISGIISLIDPELNIISKNKEKFLDIGVQPIVSDYDLIQLCFNKINFNKKLKSESFNFIKSYDNLVDFKEELAIGDISFPVFVKPINGSASLNINKVNSVEEIEILFNNYDNLMIQEFLDGTEYGVDAYIDMISGEIIEVFIKEKILMRAGETDKSRSVKNQKMLDVIKEFIIKFGFKGIIDIDIFEVEGKYYISEVNPRFGGGYPHAYEVGVNIPKAIINNLSEMPNQENIGNYKENTFMMKYNELSVLNLEENEKCE